MKKIVLFITILSFTFISCDDFLTVNPQDTTGAENYYTSPEALRANTAMLYGFPWFAFHGQLMWLAGDQLAGNVYYTYDHGGHFYYNQVGAGNSYSQSGWEGLYRAISYANSVINDMPAFANGNGVSETDINKALGEARFMRATAYIFLGEIFGEVPIIENATALITSGNPADIHVPRHTLPSIYRFICEDLEFAASVLPLTDGPGRVTYWSAKGMLARAYLIRATYENSSTYFEEAKKCAKEVIEQSGLNLLGNYADLFDINKNNNEESLFAFQCMTGLYGAGNSRNAFIARSARLGDQAWGGGVGPTVSLQQIYTPNDLRKKEVFMTNGDHYPQFEKASGGYTYQLTYRDPSDLSTVVENSNEVLANFKKYIIGKAVDNGGKVGLDQDGANNLYVLRLADVYLMYAEACIGTGTSTSDGDAMTYLNEVRNRAGIGDFPGAAITFEDIMLERRKEFAFEGINWFDVKRMYYRNKQSALDYLNGMQRDRIYRLNFGEYDNMTDADKYAHENDRKNYYLSWQTIVDPENPDTEGGDRVNNIVFTDASMFIPLPASVTTVSPILKGTPVDYYANNE